MIDYKGFLGIYTFPELEDLGVDFTKDFPSDYKKDDDNVRLYAEKIFFGLE